MSEYVQFATAMVLFITILIGSYFFVLTSPGARKQLSMGVRDRET